MTGGPQPQSEIVLYQTEDGRTRLEVRLEEETVWLSQAQMAELFQTTKQNVSLHIQNVFEEGELERAATVKESLTVEKEAPISAKSNRHLARQYSADNVGSRTNTRASLHVDKNPCQKYAIGV